MGDVIPIRPINWKRLRKDEAEFVVRNRARRDSTENVIFTDHASHRMLERTIFREDVFVILREGSCHNEPEKDEKGDWKAVFSK